MLLGGATVAGFTHLVTYLGTPRRQRTSPRRWALVLGILGALAAGAAAFRPAIDRSALPTSPDGLGPGQAWNDGGVVALTPQLSR
jgi:hypothetical protein